MKSQTHLNQALSITWTGSDYYSFGMLIKERSFSSPAYKYGFNGKEKDDEINVEGGDYDFGARIFDCRLGKFLSLDKFTNKFPYQSPYLFASNNPIIAKDINGDSTYVVIYGSQWAKPSYRGKKYDMGNIFKLSAAWKVNEIKSRAGYNEERDEVVLVYAPDETAFLAALNTKYTSGKIAEVVTYTHGSNNSIILGGSLTDSDDKQDERWVSVVDVTSNSNSPGENEFYYIDMSNFEDKCRTTLWGCNLAGTSKEDEKMSPVQAMANATGSASKARGLQGGGGAETKVDAIGKPIIDGTLIKSSDRAKQSSKTTELKSTTVSIKPSGK